MDFCYGRMCLDTVVIAFGFGDGNREMELADKISLVVRMFSEAFIPNHNFVLLGSACPDLD